MSSQPGSSYRINLLLTAVSVIAAIFSAGAAFEANRIARQAQESRVSVRYVGRFADFDAMRRPLCLLPDGSASWEQVFVDAFDFTNAGGRAVSVADYSPGGPDFSDWGEGGSWGGRAAGAYWDFFSDAEYQAWLKTVPDSIGNRLSSSSGDPSGPPIDLQPGTTRRVLMRGHVLIRTAPGTPTARLIELSRRPYTEKIVFFWPGPEGGQTWVSVPMPWIDDASGANSGIAACAQD